MFNSTCFWILLFFLLRKFWILLFLIMNLRFMFIKKKRKKEKAIMFNFPTCSLVFIAFDLRRPLDQIIEKRTVKIIKTRATRVGHIVTNRNPSSYRKAGGSRLYKFLCPPSIEENWIALLPVPGYVLAMAKPRKPKNTDDAKPPDNSGAIVRHQKLCISIDIDKRRIYGFVLAPTCSILIATPSPIYFCFFLDGILLLFNLYLCFYAP